VRVAADDDSFAKGLAAEARDDSAAALEFFLAAEKNDPQNARIENHIARRYSDLCDLQSKAAKKKEYAQQALSHAERAVQLEPKNAEYVLWVGISYGKLARVVDSRTKIDYSRVIRQKAEEAIALDPHYAQAHYVLGSWHYEIAKLTSTARFFAGLIYSKLPEGSNAVAIQEFKRAAELEPENPGHWTKLGLAYSAGNQPNEARKAWQKSVELPAKSRFDEEAQAEAKAALERK